MNIAKYSVNKPITIIMAILIVILLGVVSLVKLPLELFPDINLPYAVVVTTYEGKNPEEVERDVTIPIEQNLLTISNVKNIQSISREHFSMIIVEFEQSTNMDTAYLEMNESFERLNLKSGVGNPMIIKFDPNMLPLMMVSVTRKWDDANDNESLILTTEWIKEDVLNRLERIPGVASVSLSGASDTEIQVVLNIEKLVLHELTQEDVLRIINEQNISGLAGVVPDGGDIRMLYIGDKIIGLEALKNTPIKYDSNSGKVITLQDLADSIGFVNANVNQYMKINGVQGISIALYKQSDAGITDTVRAIKNELDKIVKSPNYEADYIILYDQGEYIEQSVGSVLENLVVGGILAVIILYVFLRKIGPTLIVAISMPISVIGTFALMYFFDISLNVVSMGGLALGIGMLVDNSIVVIENIYRLLSLGKSKKEAAIIGASQVAGAITASSLTTIAVFLPIVFLEGLTSEIFMEMALTVTFSLLASLIIALSLVPSISAQVLSEQKIKEDKFAKRLQNYYESALRFTLNKKALTMLVVVILLGLSTFLSLRKGFELFPRTDEGTINISIEMKKGTSFETTASLTDAIVEEIMKLEDYETVSAEIGGTGILSLFGATGSTDSVSITVLLKDKRKLTTQEVANKIVEIINEKQTEDVDKVTVEAQSMMQSSGLLNSGITIIVRGDDIFILRDLANELATIVSGVEGTKDVKSSYSQADDVIRIEVNKENAIKQGVTEKNILDAITNFYLSLGLSLTPQETDTLKVVVNGNEYEVTVPSNQFANFNMDYSVFLSIIQVFDSKVTQAISNKLNEKDENFELYLINIEGLPNFNPTLPQGIYINPFLRYDETLNQVYVSYNRLDTKPLLFNLSKGPIYDGNTPDSKAIITKEPGFATITRDGKSRFLTVTAGIDSSYTTSKVSSEVERRVNEYLASKEFKDKYGESGYTIEFAGENEEIIKMRRDLTYAGIVAILLVFMVMAIQFQSLKYPFIVMFTVPLAFTGGFFMLAIAGLPLTMVAIVGLIILIGVVVNNGIVLIDYINQLRQEGKDLDEAIVEAGKTRLRPILMTALTTILALIPMALGRGEGGELLQPLGLTTIGGLTYATILTLFVVPIMYKVFTRKKKVNDN